MHIHIKDFLCVKICCRKLFELNDSETCDARLIVSTVINSIFYREIQFEKDSSHVATREERAKLLQESDMAALVSRTRRRHSLGTHVKSPGLQARVSDRCLLLYTGVPFSRPVVVSGAHSCVRACVHA